ncbi:MAG: FeoB-associated Cys-rich membrane protein [Chthoniobacterales bacterium]
MNTSLQTILALALVFVTAVAFALSWWQKRHKPGCGGGCGCAGIKKKALRNK